MYRESYFLRRSQIGPRLYLRTKPLSLSPNIATELEVEIWADGDRLELG